MLIQEDAHDIKCIMYKNEFMFSTYFPGYSYVWFNIYEVNVVVKKKAVKDALPSNLLDLVILGAALVLNYNVLLHNIIIILSNK